jgi:hypothetical protein
MLKQVIMTIISDMTETIRGGPGHEGSDHH